MLLFGIALRRSFFFNDKCVSYRGIRLFFCLFFLFFRRLFFFGPVLFWVSFLGRHVAAIFLSLGGPQKMCVINRAILFVCSVFIITRSQHNTFYY